MEVVTYAPTIGCQNSPHRDSNLDYRSLLNVGIMAALKMILTNQPPESLENILSSFGRCFDVFLAVGNSSVVELACS